ncbi:MAG: PEGA domain-containing protein [Polyangiaceae bacterium]|nr:PEGA domain-containing protein [Polyangiaceae bacterium]MCL4750828.1 PEGA domain-containing protein [Myxococcales bacterium]
MRVVLVVAALALVSPGLAAQTRDATTAEALFAEGREAAKAGDFSRACAKFRESNRLDPAPGTVLNLADCEERLGHLATAWTLFREVTQRVPASDERHALALGRANALEPKLPKLTVVLAPGAPPGTRVLRDGVELGAAALDTALPVDPGTHQLTVEAPGHAPSQRRVSLREGQTERVVLTLGAKAPDEGDNRSATKSSSRRTWGYALGGVGLVGVSVGTITGLMVLGERRRVDDNCDENKRCNADGMDAVDRGRTLGTVSGASFIVGGLALAGGAYLLLSSDKEGPATALRVGPGWVGAVRRF